MYSKEEHERYKLANEKKPTPYELCKLILEDDQIMMGWWTGFEWFSRHMPSKALVKLWRYQRTPYGYVRKDA